MQKISILFSLLGAMTFVANEMENPLFKGLLIVDNTSKIKTEGREEIRGIQFDGIPANDELVEELGPILSDFPLTTNGAEALCAAITSYYQEHDDYRIAVTLPDQDTSDGVLQLVLSPEKLGKLNIKDNKHTRPEALTKWVRLKSSEPINQKVLSNDVAWMNTNPYRTVKVNYQNTDQPGVTDIDLIVSDKKSWKVTSGVDNTGNMPIGTTRIFASFNVNDFIFTDHTFKFQATTTDHYKDYQSFTVEYLAPLPWRNTLHVSGSYSGTSPNREDYPQKHKKSFQTSGRYAIPQWFGSNAWVDQITYETGFDFKGTNTNIFNEKDPALDKTMLAFVGQFAASLNVIRDRNGSKIASRLDLIGSPGRMLPQQSDADFDNLRMGARPQYFYSKLSMSLDQKFNNDWSLFLQGRGQFAMADLIPSEQFSLGGYNTVRGYDEKVVNGDNALCGNLEMRTPQFTVAGVWLPKFGDKLHFLGFVDAGYAWFHNEIEGTPRQQSLLSFGPGMRYSVSSYFSSRFDLGFPLIKVKKDNGKPHIHFSAALNY